MPPPDGRSGSSIISSSSRRSDALMPSALYPSLVVGVAAAVLALQLGSGGLTLTSFFLKLFLYVSFALFCFLLGSFGLLVKKSPPKISRFDTAKRQSGHLLELFEKLMGRFCVPLLDSAQTRRVVVSLNVDKALKEGMKILSSVTRLHVLPNPHGFLSSVELKIRVENKENVVVFAP